MNLYEDSKSAKRLAAAFPVLGSDGFKVLKYSPIFFLQIALTHLLLLEYFQIGANTLFLALSPSYCLN